MEYREIVAVTGLSGLFQLLTTKSDGAIVRNIGDKTTKFISARQHNVTPLDSIEVYTIAENVRLHNVFEKMLEHEATIPPIDPKVSDKAIITGYFKSIFPEFDDERVYVSDMKKMLKWFELLKANDLLRFETETPEETAETETTAAEEVAAPIAVAEPEAEVKPAKKAKAKKEAAEEPAADTEGAEKAPKKAAKKKKTEE